MFSIYCDNPLADWDDGEKECKGKGKGIGEWLQCSRRQGCFGESLFLIECDIISDTEFPSSLFIAPMTHSHPRIRETQTFEKWFRRNYLKFFSVLQVCRWDSSVKATPVFMSVFLVRQPIH